MQTRSVETRASILQAAYELFSDSGYDSSAVADICQAAGVSKGAFYYHFPSKQAVFLELMENWLSALDIVFNDALLDTEDAPQAIDQMAVAAAEIFQTSDIRLSILLEFWSQANRDPAIWKAAIEPYRRYHRFFSHLIQKGIEAGKLKTTDPDLVARVLVSQALGLLMQALFDQDAVDWGEQTIRSFKLIMDGLEREVR